MSLLSRDLTKRAVTYATEAMPSTVTVLEAGTSEDTALPCVVCELANLEEMDPPLYGNFAALLIFTILSHPEDTDLDEFETLAETLQASLLDVNVAAAALCAGVGEVHHLRALPGHPEAEDSLRSWTMGVEMRFARKPLQPAATEQALLTPGAGRNYLIP